MAGVQILAGLSPPSKVGVFSDLFGFSGFVNLVSAQGTIIIRIHRYHAVVLVSEFFMRSLNSRFNHSRDHLLTMSLLHPFG